MHKRVMELWEIPVAVARLFCLNTIRNGTDTDQLRAWFEDGVATRQTYMIVWCDNFDYTDYPEYCSDAMSAQYSVDHPSNMQRVVEVYDLRGDREFQLSLFRSWALRPTG